MKNNSPFSRYSTLGFIFLVAVVMYACGGSQNREQSQDQIQPPTESNAREAEQQDRIQAARNALYDGSIFRDRAQFLNNLIGPSPEEEDDKALLAPLRRTATINALLDFILMYENTTNDLDYTPTKVKFSSLEPVFDRYSKQDTFGLVFHFGYDSDDDELVYILSRGNLVESNLSSKDDIVSFCPFPSGENNQNFEHYLLLKTGSPAITPIRPSDFTDLTDDYETLIKVDTVIDNTDDYVLISTLQNHPRMVYHNPSDLWELYEAYKHEDDLDDMYLYLAHGSLHQSVDISASRHTPVFMFGTSSQFYMLLENPTGYRGAALDAGRLCPPRCPSATPTTCTKQ